MNSISLDKSRIISDADEKLEAYNYILPESFIAQRPELVRDNSKLLVYKVKTKEVIHDYFYNLHNYLNKSDQLVLNKSKVFPCRIEGRKESGGRCEFFLLSILPNDGIYKVLIKSRGRKRKGDQFSLTLGKTKFQSVIHTILEDGIFEVSFTIEEELFKKSLMEYGQIPIPPYIRGGVSDELDRANYQTEYAEGLGSVAAPTAGLHFNERLFLKLKDKGIKKSFVTLHVGLGTFRPVKSENILEHTMHEEEYFIDQKNYEQIKNHQNLIAVGTTSLRVLESIAQMKDDNGNRGFDTVVANRSYRTDIFLYPGVPVKLIKGLITNFHLPKSSLIMLVSAIIGRKKTMEIYEEAKRENYRFFSYGDAMLILR